MVIEHYKDDDPVPVYRRFREHGRLAPEGLMYVASWVDEPLARCFQVMEAPDRGLIDEWIARWSDIVEFEVVAGHHLGRGGRERASRLSWGRAQPSSSELPDVAIAGALGTLALGTLALGTFLALAATTGDFLDLDARRLDLGDDLVSRRSAASRRPGSSGRGRGCVPSKSTSDSTEYSIDCGQVVRQRADPDASRSGGGACRRAASTAGDIAGRDERHVDRQLLGHARRGTGRRGAAGG